MEEDDYLLSASSPIVLKLTPDACGVRLDKVLSMLVPQYSRSRLQQWMEAGYVTIDGKVARAKMVALGDERVVILPQIGPEEQVFRPEPVALSIVYEDASILVIHKPIRLVVHPAAGNWSGTLLNGLLYHLPSLSTVPRAGIVHRLDKDTSGLMVVAKTLEAQTGLVRQLQARSVKREYLALVWGTPFLQGKINAPIGRHPRDRLKMAVVNNASAKPAITHYQQLATGVLDGKPVSLMCCQLETGRTHQIRVHMQSVGFPLVGDPLYGKPHLACIFAHQALHAYRLGLIHPFSGQFCEWSAPLPDGLSSLFARAGITEDMTSLAGKD